MKRRASSSRLPLSYERVFYAYPNTDLAAQSSTAIERLRASPGKGFSRRPAASSSWTAAEKWLAAKEYAKARQEYATLAESLAGPEKDEAKRRHRRNRLFVRRHQGGVRYLKALHVAHSEADAERLYYLTEAARKNRQRHGNDGMRSKNSDEHYRAIGLAFEGAGRRREIAIWSPTTARSTTAVQSGRRRLSRRTATTALLPLENCLGRVSRRSDRIASPCCGNRWSDIPTIRAPALRSISSAASRKPTDKFGEARAYYERLSAQYPALLLRRAGARENHADKVAAATPDEDAAMWLVGIEWPAHRDLSATEPNPATQQTNRARAPADGSRAPRSRGSRTPLRRQDGNRTAAASGDGTGAIGGFAFPRPAHHEELQRRIIFRCRSTKLPSKFWQMLFPLPYKDEVFVNARARGLDPYDVAALIRQESEFNPAAKSRANAYGLMQLMPATGRMLGQEGRHGRGQRLVCC